MRVNSVSDFKATKKQNFGVNITPIVAKSVLSQVKSAYGKKHGEKVLKFLQNNGPNDLTLSKFNLKKTGFFIKKAVLIANYENADSTKIAGFDSVIDFGGIFNQNGKMRFEDFFKLIKDSVDYATSKLVIK